MHVYFEVFEVRILHDFCVLLLRETLVRQDATISVFSQVIFVLPRQITNKRNAQFQSFLHDLTLFPFLFECR